MRHLLSVAVLASLALPTAALADAPGRDWIGRNRVTQMLAKKGYRVIKMEADDGHWEGDAVRGRQHFEFHVDPHSGRITKLEADHD